MFLGYSEKDESLLRQHNNLTVLDAVSSLDSFMREVNNQVKPPTPSYTIIPRIDPSILLLSLPYTIRE